MTHILNMDKCTEAQLAQAARILTDSLPRGWADIKEAAAEIAERLIPENTLLAAVGDGEILGWGGILPVYNGVVFELHPLCVRGDRRGLGIGSMLILALEEAARRRGGLTMWIGADDDSGEGETTLANVDLYDDFPGHLRNFAPGTHQSAFYMKHGYKVMGVLPDANGIGKPDIFLAKRLIQ